MCQRGASRRFGKLALAAGWRMGREGRLGQRHQGGKGAGRPVVREGRVGPGGSTVVPSACAGSRRVSCPLGGPVSPADSCPWASPAIRSSSWQEASWWEAWLLAAGRHR